MTRMLRTRPRHSKELARSPRVALTALALPLLAAVTGCNGHSTAAPHARTGDESSLATSTATPRSAAGISIAKVAGFTLAGDVVGPLAMDDRRVIFPFGDAGQSDYDRVASIDIADGSRQTLARSQWAAGLINWVAVTGDWVAWVDQSHRQGDDDPRVLWRVWALNTSTHARRLLSSNGDVPDPYVPQVHGRDNYLFWTQAEADRSARERVWRTDWTEPRDLLRHTEMTPGSESLTRGQLIYLGPSGLPGRGHTVGGDCWSAPLDGSQAPRPRTHTALAMGCSTSDNSLVWTQHIDPGGPLPADGILDDPYEFLASPLTGGPARLLHRGYLATGYPVAGTGFVLWHGIGGNLVAHSLSSNAAAKLPARADGGAVTSDGGHLVAYRTAGSTATSLTVARVTLPH